MMADGSETVSFASRGRGQGVPGAAGATGARKCRTWSRLRHTGQSDASWAGTLRAFKLSCGPAASHADARAADGSKLPLTTHAWNAGSAL